MVVKRRPNESTEGEEWGILDGREIYKDLFLFHCCLVLSLRVFRQNSRINQRD